MQRVFLSLALLAGLSLALAQPFVWQAAWTTSEPGEAQYGGTVTEGSISDVRTFQPVLSSEENLVIDMMDFAQLLRLPPDSDEWLPYAAESYTVTDDVIFDFVLREGLRWSDGSPITVQDYYAGYLLQTDPDTGSNKYDFWFVNDVQVQAEITGERSIRFTFPEPNRDAYNLVGGILFPVPDWILGEAYRTGGAEAVNAMWGTESPIDQLLFNGPFMLTSYLPGERLVFARNPYFGEWNVDSEGNPLPYLDGRTFRIGDRDALFNLFLAGELDLFAPANLDQVGLINLAVQNGDIDATLIEGYGAAGSSQFIVFNWNKASNQFLERVFRNADFRRAMWHLVDRDLIIDLVYQGAAEPMHSGVYLTNEYWLDESTPRYDYDPERAEELLARAGFSRRDAQGFLVDAEGRRLSFRLATNAGNPQREQITQIFADSAREVGVEVITDALDFPLLVDWLLATGDDRPFDAILIGLGGGNRVWPFGPSVYLCTGALHMYNLSGECITPQESLIDQLNRQGQRTLDTPAAREIGLEIQALETDMAAVLYTVSPHLHTAWQNRVQGELPQELMGGLTGTRANELVLTWVR